MKKIILLNLVVFLYSLTSNSQIPQPNGNILNNSLDKFTGTWEWIGGTDTIRIVLKKKNIVLPFPENSRADMLIGFHIYKKGNSLIESSITHSSTSYTDKYSTILGGNDNDNNIFTGTLKDLTKNKLVKLKLVLNANQTQLQWQTDNTEGVKIVPYTPGFTLPRSFTLIKKH